MVSIYINGYINQHLYASHRSFSSLSLKYLLLQQPIIVFTLLYVPFLATVLLCIWLYHSVGTLQKHKLSFFKITACTRCCQCQISVCLTKTFFQVAHASSCLLRRHKSIFRSHIGSFIIAIILKVILVMQHNSVNKTKKYKLKYWFPITYSLATPNKKDREKENTLLHADWN